MYIVADLSGIQDFLFHVRDEGGGQAASVRSRSFRIQLIAEVLGQQLLRSLQPYQPELLFCSAGKVLLRSSTSAAQVHEHFGVLQSKLNHWLLQNTHGLLRLSLAVSDNLGSEQQQYQQAMDRLTLHKLKAWQSPATNSWSAVKMVTHAPMDVAQHARNDEDLGHRLRNQSHWWAAFDQNTASNTNATEYIFDLNIDFFDQEPVAVPAPIFKARLDTLLRHIPRDVHGNAVEFVDLATKADGAPMLAVLKADADSLGLVMNQVLGSKGIAGMKALSKQLENFFGTELDKLMRSDNNRNWSNLYTIFPEAMISCWSAHGTLSWISPGNCIDCFTSSSISRHQRMVIRP